MQITLKLLIPKIAGIFSSVIFSFGNLNSIQYSKPRVAEHFKFFTFVYVTIILNIHATNKHQLDERSSM